MLTTFTAYQLYAPQYTLQLQIHKLTIGSVTPFHHVSTAEMKFLAVTKHERHCKARTDPTGLPYLQSDCASQNSCPDMFQTHSDATPLQVAAYTKRTLVPDHLVGEFTVPMPRPGATEKLSGTLSKKGDENGVVRFTVSSTAAGAAPAAGSAAAAGSPQAQPTPTAVARPAAGAAASGTALGELSA